MFELIFTPLRRIFLMALVTLHAVMLAFAMQRFPKTEVRAFLARAFFRPSATELTKAKKPKIPFLIAHPATQGQPTLQAGELVALKANQTAQWRVDHEWIGEGKEVLWSAIPGQHVIQARHHGEEQRIIIEVQ